MRSNIEDVFNSTEGVFTYPGLYIDMVKRFEDNSSFVEIGSYVGKSLSFLAKEIHDSKKTINLVSVDLFVDLNNEYEHDRMNKFFLNTSIFRDSFDLIIADSSKASGYFRDKSLEFVFIDANHEYEYVKKDIISWLPKVKNGGVIAGHDYRWDFPGVEKAVHEIFGNKVSTKYLSEICWLVEL